MINLLIIDKFTYQSILTIKKKLIISDCNIIGTSFKLTNKH